MTLVERDTAFRNRLAALYLDDNLGLADGIIHHARTAPATFLTTAERGRALVLALELWAAIFGQRHPALLVDELDPWNRKRWRHATDAKGTLEALLLLSQSPHGAEFADDVHSLRPRLFAIAQRHEEIDRRQARALDETSKR